MLINIVLICTILYIVLHHIVYLLYIVVYLISRWSILQNVNENTREKNPSEIENKSDYEVEVNVNENTREKNPSEIEDESDYEVEVPIEDYVSQDYFLPRPTDESPSDLTTIIDIRTAQKIQEANIPIPSLPNPAYKAFIELITKHKLADSAANDIIQLFNNFHMDPTANLPSNAKSARTLLDSMQIPHTLYKKTVIMEYDQIQYTLYHRTIYDAIKELK